MEDLKIFFEFLGVKSLDFQGECNLLGMQVVEYQGGLKGWADVVVSDVTRTVLSGKKKT